MIRNDTEADNRGQVGIGTLIVFIAMVLVAAIAAGVLINTAGFLQTQAEDTGTESTQQVADNLNVITETGEVGNSSDNGDASEITEIQLGVQPAAGADDINLADLSLQLVSDNQFANLIQSQEGDQPPDEVVSNNTEDNNEANLPEYGVSLVDAETEGDVIMTDGSDRYELIINATHDADDGVLDPFDEGENIEIDITTGDGAQTVAFLQVPDSLTAEEEDDMVNL